MEEKNMTVEEVLKITINNLKEIQLPVMMADTASRIAGSIKNIQLCINAIEQGQQEEAKKQETPEGNEDGREADPE